MTDAESRLARLEVMLANLAADVAEHHATVMEQIQGGPGVKREDSLRGRLHSLENDRAAASVAARALAEARRERIAAQRERKRAELTNRAQWWRLAGAAIAIAAIAAPYVHGAVQ